MQSKPLPPVRTLPDEVGKGYKTTTPAWSNWPATHQALSTTYYLAWFPEADQLYALAGLQMMADTFAQEHGGKEVAQEHIDAAAAHEVRYHALRARQWRRPCAALATCWLNIVLERPERILDRHERAHKRLKTFTRRNKADATEANSPVTPHSSLALNPFAENARILAATRKAHGQTI